jgi:hypothetical protein
MKNHLLYYGLFLLLGCQGKTDKTTTTPADETAQQIIDQAIEKQGGAIIADSRIAFDFRDKHYASTRNGGNFTYERIFTNDQDQKVHDVLTNKGLQRKIDETVVVLSSKDSAAYSNSVNSVLYFALLPYYLNDPAVQKKYLGEVNVKGQAYHKIKVVFAQEGGGKDFEDEYVYWIHTEKGSMDYLAYNYQVDGGGARFREAYNVRIIDGVRFADYINYKPKNNSMNVEEFDELFEKGKLKELSRIDLENIIVERL